MELNFVRDRLAKPALGGFSQEFPCSRWIRLALILGLAGAASLVGCASGASPQVQQMQLVVSPSALSFGNISVGSSSTQTVTLINSGAASVTVSQASVSGAGFSNNGLTPPLTLPPGQSSTITVRFAPQAAGSATGSLTVVSNDPHSPSMIALNGTGDQPQLSVIPTSVSFGDVAVGTRNTQTITLINSGTGNMTISQATPSGNGFSITGLTVPLTLSAGQRTSFNVAFAPISAGSVTGSLSLVSDTPNSPSTIA